MLPTLSNDMILLQPIQKYMQPRIKTFEKFVHNLRIPLIAEHLNKLSSDIQELRKWVENMSSAHAVAFAETKKMLDEFEQNSKIFYLWSPRHISILPLSKNCRTNM